MGNLKKILAVLFIAGVCLSSTSFSQLEQKNLCTETYIVRAGDTFWDVSCRYRDLDARNLYIMEYQDELRELNSWLKDAHCQLKPNDVLTVHYVRKE